MTLERPQRWAMAAAWLAVVGALAPVVWRVHMLIWGAGWPLAPEYRHGSGLVYVLTLMTVEGLAGLATLGLVQDWGRRLPIWVPGLGGRAIPRGVVLVVATLGAVVLTVVVTVTAWTLTSLTRQGVSNPITQVHGWHRAFLYVHYVPALLWPIGLWVAIVGYARRTSRL